MNFHMSKRKFLNYQSVFFDSIECFFAGCNQKTKKIDPRESIR